MSAQNIVHQSKKVWTNVAAAAAHDQPEHFWRWASEVVAAQTQGEITIKEAAELLIWPDEIKLSGLESAANVLIVLDTADAIVEGDAYIGAPDKEQRDWTNLVDQVKRHND
jgi:hypothetical protein